MALSRRTGQRFQASIWPGFVDAITSLLLVLVFVLTIFMVVQFVLRETISGQESELDRLTVQVQGLADALGLEQTRAEDLEDTLRQAQVTAEEQGSLIATLRLQLDDQSAALDAERARVTSFEAQVASLLSERDEARAEASELEQRQAALLSEQEAMQLALARAREEVDESAEQARLAAARRDALQALIAGLRRSEAAAKSDQAALAVQVDALQTQISDAEAAQLADAAAVQALRDKLEGADAELTAMTLALEEQRARAEETLTLLAAAEAAKDALGSELETARLDSDEALSDAERRAALLATAHAALSDEEALSAEQQRRIAALNEQVAALRGQLGSLQALLDDARARDAVADVQIETLGSDLNAALARAAAEERRRRQLEEDARRRLEAEAQDLERYRSEFFGRLREVLGGQEGVRIEGDRFVFSSEVLFPPAEVELSDEGKREIAKVAAILSNVADEIPPEIDWVIRVDGHTDDTPLLGVGRYRNNWELSQGRALSVVQYMIEELGLPPGRLAATGFGEYQPVNTDDTDQARAQNRRIELKFTEK